MVPLALVFGVVLLAILVFIPLSVAVVKDLVGLLVDRFSYYSSSKPRWVAYYLIAVVAFLTLVVVFG